MHKKHYTARGPGDYRTIVLHGTCACAEQPAGQARKTIYGSAAAHGGCADVSGAADARTCATTVFAWRWTPHGGTIRQSCVSTSPKPVPRNHAPLASRLRLRLCRRDSAIPLRGVLLPKECMGERMNRSLNLSFIDIPSSGTAGLTSVCSEPSSPGAFSGSSSMGRRDDCAVG